MTRDPIRDAFDLLEPDIERPSAQFANELFEHLVEQTKESGGKRARRWGRLPTPPLPVRKALTIAAALAIAALLVLPLLPLIRHRVPEAPGSPSQIATVGGSDIVIVDASTGEELARETCRDCEPYAPAWSPDGSRIAFFGRSATDCSYNPDCSSVPTRRQGIYVIEAGGQLRQLTNCVATCVAQPFAWSPDGTQLAYVDVVDASTTKLIVLNVDGSGSRVLAGYPGPPAYSEAGPAWSPDGETIAYVRREGTASHLRGPDQVAVVDVRTRRTRTLRAFPGGIGSVAWSPDGAHIALDVSTPQRDSVVVMNADGTAPTSIAQGPTGTGPGDPIWAPDGSSLAFIVTPHYRSGYGVEIWTTRADGSERTRVYEQRCCMDGAWITWSPDASMIGFAVDDVSPDAYTKLYVMNRDGANLRQIVQGSGISPIWRPAPNSNGGT